MKHTTVTVSGNGIFSKENLPNVTHRKAYITVLRMISRNQLIDGSKKVKLLSIAHDSKNYTRLLIEVDDTFPFNVYINTYE